MKTAQTIKKSDIIDIRFVCPYCMWDIDEYGACCGEVGHATKAYITEEEAFLIDDTEVVE